MIRTLAQLKDACDSLQLEVDPEGYTKAGKPKLTKHCYITALGKHFLRVRYGDTIPRNLKFRLSMKAPMLAFQYTNLKQEEKEAIWNSRDWVLTEKENGVRGILVYSPKEGLNLYSRNVSVDDYLPVEFTDRLLHTIQPKAFPHAFALDVEIKSTNRNVQTYLAHKKGVETETELQAVAALLQINPEDSQEIQRVHEVEQDEHLLEYKVIDVLFWPPVGDLRSLAYGERRKYYGEAVEAVAAAGLNVKHIISCAGSADEKKAFHQGILDRMGEGTVAANVSATYNDRNTRGRNEWVKIKRSVSGAMKDEGLGDTIDGWIGGYEEADEAKGWGGMVGALLVYTLLRKDDGSEVEHLIAVVTNIPLSLRKQMTHTDGGKVKLNPEWYDRVVEVDGQAISPRSMRLTHPRIVRHRTDKSKWECTLDEGFLRSMVV